MVIIDIHTHHYPATSVRAIVNVTHPAAFHPRPGAFYSVGFHPWLLSHDGSENWALLSDIVARPEVLAIGEAGLDKAIGVDYERQKAVFERQAVLAIEVGKPLIIHCVRSYNEIIELKKTLKPTNPWIIHGYHGKETLARQLTAHGIYLSYGFRYQPLALLSTPIDMLFLETDEQQTDIQLLYADVAKVLSLSVNQLTERIQENFRRVFGDSAFAFLKLQQ